MSLESYSRVRLVFEATRDGGLWGVRWNVTDRMPWSDAIWQSWATGDFSGHVPEITAEAECDELSAFFSFLARDLGIQGFVGLFWPTWNHTVAVWEVRKGASDKSPGVGVRLVVPTSQVWLSREATLGTREFKANRVVFAYQRADLKPDSTLAGPLACHLIAQLRRYGALSNDAAGKIDIAWQVDPTPQGGRMRLRWQESGGPPVKPPRRKGFGSRLIEGGLARDLDGEVHLDYKPAGLVCQITMPVPRSAVG